MPGSLRMDEYGLEAIWLFPTLGVLYEELLKDDGFAVTSTFRAFNRWLEEDWGFAYEDRIFAAPYLTLADLDWAVTELEWALDKGARVIVMRPAAVFTEHGPRSPADPVFDPFWARVDEAGITVVVHAGDSGYSSQGYADDRFTAQFSGGWSPSVRMFAIERAALRLPAHAEPRQAVRPASRTCASPRWRTARSSCPTCSASCASTAKKYPGWFGEDPVETFRRHVWINPFWEDDPYEIVELMGADRVIFGSDWPHIEGMPRPLDYVPEVKELSAEDQRRVLRDNTWELTRPAA